jgi:hypothetical protein
VSGNCGESGQAWSQSKQLPFLNQCGVRKVSGAVEGVNFVGTTLIQNRKATVSLISVSSHNAVQKDGGSKVQEAIWRLQDEVKVLQEELVRTRRALEQREVLLRNSQQREVELRAEVGAGKR